VDFFLSALWVMLKTSFLNVEKQDLSFSKGKNFKLSKYLLENYEASK
jgi:hypothetical protein